MGGQTVIAEPTHDSNASRGTRSWPPTRLVGIPDPPSLAKNSRASS
jgi:hypothetical protein